MQYYKLKYLKPEMCLVLTTMRHLKHTCSVLNFILQDKFTTPTRLQTITAVGPVPTQRVFFQEVFQIKTIRYQQATEHC